MTAAFEKFVRQYKMTGTEKADGYSPDVFVGLDGYEKEQVFKLLTTELPWSVEWLFRLNPEKALAVVKDEEERLRGNRYVHVYMLQQQLVKYTGDILYQRHMIEDYPNYVEDLKPHVIDAVGCTPANAAAIEFFKRVILVEANTSAVARASRNLLNAIKFPRSSEEEKNVTTAW